MNYCSVGEFATKIGKTVQTLRNANKNISLKPSNLSDGKQCIVHINNLITSGFKVQIKLNK